MYKSLKLQGQGYNLRIFLRNVSNLTNEKPIESAIRKKLEAALNPVVLDITNVSNKHNVPKGSETHFNVIIVSDKFEGHPVVKRHRMVYEILEKELQDSVHALSIDACPPSVWPDFSKTMIPKPICRSGFGK